MSEELEAEYGRIALQMEALQARAQELRKMIYDDLRKQQTAPNATPIAEKKEKTKQ